MPFLPPGLVLCADDVEGRTNAHNLPPLVSLFPTVLAFERSVSFAKHMFLRKEVIRMRGLRLFASVSGTLLFLTCLATGIACELQKMKYPS